LEYLCINNVSKETLISNHILLCPPIVLYIYLLKMVDASRNQTLSKENYKDMFFRFADVIGVSIQRKG